ncbi:MAG: hypothetical protein AAF433_17915 [Bacteroidota bacterium]
MPTSTAPPILLRICAAVLWAISGFLLGGLIAAWLTPKGAGLAAGANVLVVGLIGTFSSALLLWFMSRRADRRWLKLSIAYALSAMLLLMAGLYWLAQKRDQARQEQGELLKQELTNDQLAAYSNSTPFPNRAQQPLEQVVGLGFANMPISNEITRLDFYADPLAWVPIDSFLLQGEHVHYAPPYLLPYYQKLDYNQLTFRWLAVAQDRVQIELNAQQRRTAWVPKNQLRLSYWPDFLVQLFAVEAIDPASNPLRIKPLDNASTTLLPEGIDFLRPLQVNDEWIFLEFWYEGQGEYLGEGGWIRWRDGDDLLVTWDYRL